MHPSRLHLALFVHCMCNRMKGVDAVGPGDFSKIENSLLSIEAHCCIFFSGFVLCRSLSVPHREV